MGEGEGFGESLEGEESGGGQWERGCDESTDSDFRRLPVTSYTSDRLCISGPATSLRGPESTRAGGHLRYIQRWKGPLDH